MAASDAVLRTMVVLSIVLYSFLLLRLSLSRLIPVYRFFSAYIAIQLCRTAILANIEPRTNLYAEVWMVAEPVSWILYILVALELYALVLKQYPGIATLGRFVLIGAVAASLAIALLTTLPDLAGVEGPSAPLLYIMVLQRGVVSALTILLLLISAFLLWYPVPLSRNLLIHFVLFAVYFVAKVVVLLAVQMTGQQVTRAANIGLLAVANTCLFCWIALLCRQGERRSVIVGHKWNPAREEQLVAQLNAVNDSLLRVARN